MECHDRSACTEADELLGPVRRERELRNNAHKSQGSEYPAVVIPVLTQHYAMLQRNLLYTGVTRGRRLVVLVGQKKAVAIAVRNVSGRRRWSKLDEWLADPASVRIAASATITPGRSQIKPRRSPAWKRG